MASDRPQAAGFGLVLQAIGAAVIVLGGLEAARRIVGPQNVADEAARILEQTAERLRDHRGD